MKSFLEEQIAASRRRRIERRTQAALVKTLPARPARIMRLIGSWVFWAILCGLWLGCMIAARWTR